MSRRNEKPRSVARAKDDTPTPSKAAEVHPSRAQYRLVSLFGLGAVGYGLFMMFVFGSLLLGGLLAGVGGALIALGRRGQTLGRAVMLVNAALARIAEGELIEAESLLASAEEISTSHTVVRAVAVQRSMIALRRGQLEDAEREATKALAQKNRFRLNLHAAVQNGHARGLRAVARAGLGDVSGAEKDIADVLSDPFAAPAAQAKATLAKAIIADGAGDTGVLRTVLDTNRTLLDDATEPRERALARAFRRKLVVTRTSPYRERRRAAHQTDELSITDWAEAVAPGAAPYVRDSGDAAAEPALPTYAATGARAKLPQRRTQVQWDALLVAMLSVFGFAGLVLFSSSRDGGAPGSPTSIPDGFVLGGVWFVILLAAFVVYRVGRTRRQTAALIQAANLVTRGDPAGQKLLRKLVDDPLELIGASAALHLSEAEEQEGDLKTALDTVEKGLRRIAHYGARVAAADLLLPGLVAERAFLYAAKGRLSDAEEDLRSLAPGYAFRPRAVFRVELLRLLSEEGIAAAGAFVGTGELDRHLTARDELLADVIRAAWRPELAGPLELGRLREELRAGTRRRRWLEAVAPDALRAFERIDEDDVMPARIAVEPTEGADPRDRAAEQQDEADAEIEAAEAHSAAAVVARAIAPAAGSD